MKKAPTLLGPPATRKPTGGEVAGEATVQPWSQIAPCDDKPAPAGRQQQHLFVKGNFND